MYRQQPASNVAQEAKSTEKENVKDMKGIKVIECLI
jgi:hypothetical protein